MSTNCIPCSTMDDSFLLSIEQVQERLANDKRLCLWKLETEGSDSDSSNRNTTTTTNSCPRLIRTYIAKDFQAALDSINAMGVIAERESHHPDFHLFRYRHIRVTIYTHKLQGLTENDLTLAILLSNKEEVPIEYSPKWLKEHPEAL